MPISPLSPLIALAVTYPTCAAVLVVLRRLALVDRPNARSSHSIPTPRGGGLAPAFGVTVAVLASDELREAPGMAVLVAAWPIALIGLVDDIRGMPALARLALQPLAVAVGCLLLVAHWSAPPFLALALATWVTCYVNVFNFMDGINGIAVAQALVAGGTWYVLGSINDIPVVATAGAALALAMLGFAPYNFPSARMFLGDVGSYFIGAWMSLTAALALAAGLAPEAVLAPLAVPLADTATTLIRRVRRGERWHEAHRDHVYQRLTQQGWSHTRTTVVVGGVMVACATLGAAGMGDSIALRASADILLLAVVVCYLCAPPVLARHGARLRVRTSQ